MSFTEAIKSVFSKYVGFSGRARRAEYWYFVLFNVVVSLVLGFIDRNVFGADINILTSIWSIGVLLPSLAVTFRRLHDVGKSGWYYLFILIPLVGPILLIVWLATDSKPGDNQYGPNPKMN